MEPPAQSARTKNSTCRNLDGAKRCRQCSPSTRRPAPRHAPSRLRAVPPAAVEDFAPSSPGLYGKDAGAGRSDGVREGEAWLVHRSRSARWDGAVHGKPGAGSSPGAVLEGTGEAPWESSGGRWTAQTGVGVVLCHDWVLSMAVGLFGWTAQTDVGVGAASRHALVDSCRGFSLDYSNIYSYSRSKPRQDPHHIPAAVS